MYLKEFKTLISLDKLFPVISTEKANYWVSIHGSMRVFTVLFYAYNINT